MGIDDGPFDKHTSRTTPIVGVMMEGADLVEAVAISEFPVDGEGVTDFLASWIEGLRFRPALQGVLFGGITIAGLAVVEIDVLATRLGVPVLAVNRRDPTDHRLGKALEAAGLEARLALVERSPRSFPLAGTPLHAAQAGSSREDAERLVAATRRKSELPEPLRLAHLIARALVTKESRRRP